MTKADIVSEISKATGIDKASVLLTVEKFMETVKDSLSNGENIKFLESLIYKVSMASGLKNRGVKTGHFLVINIKVR